MSRYADELLEIAEKLDAVSHEKEYTKYVESIVKENSDKAALMLLTRISQMIDSTEHTNQETRLASEIKTKLIEYYGYKKITDICSGGTNKIDERTLEELLNELNNLIGLENVKQKVNDLIRYQKVQKLRRENKLFSKQNTLHMAFTGNPGTGKTTVARIVGHIYKKIGLLSKGHFIEVSRTDLIAGYQGQTALKVKSVIERAKGGVLFIDEAYSITENDHSDSYGRECLTELTKALEDYREDLVVIVAGYTEPMSKFFESNPGLKSRFNTFLEFNDYNVDELERILIGMCKTNDYDIDERLYETLRAYFSSEIEKKEENFANGRLVRNVYENMIMNHARRVSNIEQPSKRDLLLLIKEDFKM